MVPVSASPRLAPVLRTLENRRFRLFVLTVFAVPLLVGWFWQTFLQPILLYGTYDPRDFHVYMGAAWALAHAQDPYLSFLRSTVPDPAFNRGYIYPPFLAWTLQPVAGLQGAGLDIAQLVLLEVSLGFGLWLLLRRTWLSVVATARVIIAIRRPLAIGARRDERWAVFGFLTTRRSDRDLSNLVGARRSWLVLVRLALLVSRSRFRLLGRLRGGRPMHYHGTTTDQ